ncbi:MAG: hypothetical protein R3E54_11290 [Halioglobus sp.]
MHASITVYVLEPDKPPGDGLGSGVSALLKTYDMTVEAFTDVHSLCDAVNAAISTDACLLLSLAATDDRGIRLVETLSSALPELPIIVLGNDSDSALRQRFVDAGAIDLVNKGMVDAYVFTRLSKVIPGETSLPQTAASHLQLANGATVTLRMITPEDAEIEQQFVTALSDRSRYLRFSRACESCRPSCSDTLLIPSFP